MDIVNTRDLGISEEGFALTAHLVYDPGYEDPAAPFGIVIVAEADDFNGEASLWMTDESILDGDGDEFAHGYGPDLIREAIDNLLSQVPA